MILENPWSDPTHPSLLMTLQLPPLVTEAPVRVARESTDPAASTNPHSSTAV